MSTSQNSESHDAVAHDLVVATGSNSKDMSPSCCDELEDEIFVHIF